MVVHHSTLETQNSKLSRACLAGLAALAFIFAYFPVWKDLITAWSGLPENSHGFFIIPICLFLAWQKRSRLSSLPVQGSNWGLAIIIMSLLTYLFGHVAEIITLRSLSMVPLIAGTVIYLYGFSIFKELIFPTTLLLFMIPIPSQIYSSLTIPLQLLVSKVSVGAAKLLGVPVYGEGNVIHLADRTLQVVRACSGMRSMVSLLALSAIFGYLTLRSNFLRALLFFLGIPIAIAVNIFRVLLMILAFNYFALDLTKGAFHTCVGLLVFAIALAILVILKRVISPWDRSLAQS